MGIKNKTGKEIFCRLDFPDEFEAGTAALKKHPAVLVVHGFKGYSTQRHIKAISKSLNGVGIVTLRPDLTKNPGDSYLEFPDMTYAQELSDLEDVYRALPKMKGVDPVRIGICGHSLGGMLAVEVASRHSEIKSLVTLSAVYDFRFMAKNLFNKPFGEVERDFNERGWSTIWSISLARELHIKRQFYEDIMFRTAGKFAAKVKCPTLVISGGEDEAVSQDHAGHYLANISSKTKKMEIIEGADHNYSGESLEKVCLLVCKWFSRAIG